MNIFEFIAVISVCTFIFTGCGEQAVHGENNQTGTETAQSGLEMEGSVVLTERQKEILSRRGLSTDYEKLNDSEKSAIAAIEYMLSYLENKYGDKFVYTGYVDGRNGLEREHLTVYPEKGSMKDVVTVYRTYADGVYTCTDDYINVLAREAYQTAVEKFSRAYFPEGIIVTRVKKVPEEKIPDEDRLLWDISAQTEMIFDESVVSKEQAGAFLKDYSAYMQESDTNVSSLIEVYLMDSDTVEAFDTYDFENSLLHSSYSYCGVFKKTMDGEISVREYGPK